jgi:hypothetical protein
VAWNKSSQALPCLSGALLRCFRLLCFFFREVGGLFCFKGRGKVVLSTVARRRAVRARGSLGASSADVCSTMSSSRSWGQVSSAAQVKALV